MRHFAPEYEMYSPEGNEAVAEMVEQLLQLPITTTPTDLEQLLIAAMNRVAEFHPEVWDTAVREAIVYRLEAATGRQMSIYF